MPVRPGMHAGESARITLTPPFENFVIDNHVITSERGERKIRVYRSASGRELHLWGVIPRGEAGYTEELAIGDPALYAAEVLRDALLRRGISIRGQAEARHRFPDEAASAPAKLGTVLAPRAVPAMTRLTASRLLQELGLLVVEHGGDRRGQGRVAGEHRVAVHDGRGLLPGLADQFLDRPAG